MTEKMYLCSMEKYAIILSILLTTYALQANAQPCSTPKNPLTATVVGELAPELGNTSALFYWENRLWTSNDHGNLTLHCLDTLTAATLQQVGCDTSFNDMEEVAQDSVYFYFGDFGNNHERLRNDLRILRMRKSDLTRGLCRFDTIAFTYSGYDPAGAGARRLPTTDYDCEAMVAVGDSLFLFTKQWSSRRTTCFALPKEPGTYTALPRFTMDVDGLVTGACHTARVTPEGTRQVLALCGYSLLLKPFVFVMYGFDGNAFDQGHHDRYQVDLLDLNYINRGHRQCRRLALLAYQRGLFAFRHQPARAAAEHRPFHAFGRLSPPRQLTRCRAVPDRRDGGRTGSLSQSHRRDTDH